MGASTVSMVSVDIPAFSMMDATKPGAPPTRGVLNMDSQACDFTQEGII